MLSLEPIMTSHLLFPRLGLGVVLLLASLATIDTVPAQDPARDQKIADIEKQLADLTKKVEELRRADAKPPTPAGALPDDWVKQLRWRSIGPAAMGGRITAISVFEADPTT